MNKKLVLSNSQFDRYNNCPTNYKYYYIDRLRETTFGSPLPFGSAIDNTLNTILEEFKNTNTIKCDYKSLFVEKWLYTTFNDELIYLPDSLKIKYSAKDLCLEILTKEDLDKLNLKIKELTPDYEGLSLNIIYEDIIFFKNRGEMTEKQHTLLNNIYWFCVKNKGILMLESYINNVIPTFDKVLEIQKKIELVDENGNSVIGFIDAIVKFKDDENVYILDNKTSGLPYKPNQVETSRQLSTYCYALNLNYAAYAVMIKKINLNKVNVCTSCGFKSKGSHKTCNNLVNSVRCNGIWSQIYSPESPKHLL